MLWAKSSLLGLGNYPCAGPLTIPPHSHWVFGPTRQLWSCIGCRLHWLTNGVGCPVSHCTNDGVSLTVAWATTLLSTVSGRPRQLDHLPSRSAVPIVDAWATPVRFIPYAGSARSVPRSPDRTWPSIRHRLSSMDFGLGGIKEAMATPPPVNNLGTTPIDVRASTRLGGLAKKDGGEKRMSLSRKRAIVTVEALQAGR